MAYRVSTSSFEGPFDLLLYLVSKQRVDIGSINITEITDQYLERVRAMQLVDLDVASDFLVVASTLLEIKAASLLPSQKVEVEEELEGISEPEMRDVLLGRLLTYKQYKNAAAGLESLYIRASFMHTRNFGPDASLRNLFPDFLEGISLDALANLCVGCVTRRNRFLLESEHIAAKPIPVELHVRALFSRIRAQKHLRFSQIVNADTPTPLVVVSFLAVLELYKRSMITIVQEESFGDIVIDHIEGANELFLDDEDGITSAEE